MLRPSYMNVDGGSPVFLSLRALLMPPQSPPRTEVSAWLVGVQGGREEEGGAARREEGWEALSCASDAGQDRLLAGLAAGQHGGPPPHCSGWCGAVGMRGGGGSPARWRRLC